MSGKVLETAERAAGAQARQIRPRQADGFPRIRGKGPEIHEGMLNRVEAAIRAYDPCLSCSTHAVGQMPIQADIIAPDGTLVKTLQRN